MALKDQLPLGRSRERSANLERSRSGERRGGKEFCFFDLQCARGFKGFAGDLRTISNGSQGSVPSRPITREIGEFGAFEIGRASWRERVLFFRFAVCKRF